MAIIDALEIEPNQQLDADICIVGGGAAGIAIAREFIGTQYQVLLLESGGLASDPAVEALYEVESVGHPLRIDDGYVSRNRYWGGSTNTWAGRCIPLNPIDFEVRDWVPDSGWPLSKSDLDPYYARAARLLQLPSYTKYNATAWRHKMLRPQPGFLYQDSVATPEVALYAESALKMGKAYGQQLQEAANITVCLHANLREIEANPPVSSVQQLHVTTLSGSRFWVKSKVYILACGGWENARLLLLSRSQCQAGLGNQNDLVGRYYMEHPKIFAGYIYPHQPILKSPIFLEPYPVAGGFVQLGLRLTDSLQQEQRLLNHYLELRPDYPEGMPEAYQAFRWLGSHLKRMQLPATAAEDWRTFRPHLGNLANFYGRKWLNWPINYPRIAILNHFEQSPNPASRVTLSRDRDALGLNRLRVDLKIASADKYSLMRLHEILADHLHFLGVGELVSDLPMPESPWADLHDSSHHMGTTRMHDSPTKGVVDRHCRVHGLNNLYIASSSVFPTVGHANPTLTIAALALRLADHLKTRHLPQLTQAEVLRQPMTAGSSSRYAP